MNKIILLTVIAFPTLLACSKNKDRNATVVDDCNGVYLTINGKNYNVCNSNILKPYKGGDKVNVTYTKIEECPNPDYKAPMCLVGHANEGWIEVTKVKR